MRELYYDPPLASGLRFNGRPLPRGVRLEGYTLWSPSVDFRTVDVPGRRGLIRAGKKISVRSLRLDLVIWGENMFEAAAAARDLRAWCTTAGPAPLYLPDVPEGYLLAECEVFPAPDMAQPWESFSVQFVMHTPEFIRDAETRVALPGAVRIGGTLDAPLSLAFDIPAELTNPVWTVGGHLIQLSGAVPAGKLTLDSEHGVIRLDGDDVGALATLESDLTFALSPGRHVVTAPDGVTGTARWRDRWL